MVQLYNVELQNSCDRLKHLLFGMFEKTTKSLNHKATFIVNSWKKGVLKQES